MAAPQSTIVLGQPVARVPIALLQSQTGSRGSLSTGEKRSPSARPPVVARIPGRGWIIQTPVLLAALIVVGALAAIWWYRERRMASLRKQIQALNALGEEVIAAGSPAEVLRRVKSTLPSLWRASTVSLYVLNRPAKMLEGVDAATGAAEIIDPEAPRAGMASEVASCFRKRALMAIPDTRRNAVARHDHGAAPRSVLLVPMLAQNETMGVLALHHYERVHYFSGTEQGAMQHLANQVATALKLQEQQATREQLFRSEKLAATGQLISGVANELRSPLDSIALSASTLRSRGPGASMELESIAAEARRASDIVARLVSFAKLEQSLVESVDVNALLGSVLNFRAPENRAKNLEVKKQLTDQRTTVMASPGQLEQVFLNLLVEAEKSAEEAAREKTITVSTSLLAGRVLLEISYPARSADLHKPDSAEKDHAGPEALGLGVCRGVIQSCGGEFRVVHFSPSQARFEIELPMMETGPASLSGASPVAEAGRPLTILVVEPDTKIQRQLVKSLGGRGDRVVPVSSADEGADDAQRVRFDLVICEMRLPGLNWVEFFERVRQRAGAFILLADAFDPVLARVFKNGEGFVLPKPIDEAELFRICRTVEERAMVSR